MGSAGRAEGARTRGPAPVTRATCPRAADEGKRAPLPGPENSIQRHTTNLREISSMADRYDVVVVGAGNAALCAALAAQENGARVLVLERAPEAEHGGNSRFTAGAIRFVYDGVDDLSDVDARPHRGARSRTPISAPTPRTSSSTTWPRHAVPHRSGPVELLVTRSHATPCSGCARRASASCRSTAGRPSRSTASSSSGAA